MTTQQRPWASLTHASMLVLVAALTVTMTFALSAAHATERIRSDAWRSVVLDPQRVAVAGTTIAYAELGEGPALVMLNGTGSPMAEWDPALLAELARTHHVVVFDYPGLGLSGPAPARYRFDRAADQIASFIESISPGEPVDVLGWSMGGFIAQQLAIRHPEDIRSLVLAGTNPGGSQAVLGPQWVQDADSDSGESIESYLVTNYPRTRSAQAKGRAFVQRLTAAVNSGNYPKEGVSDRTYEAMVAAEDPWLRSKTNRIALPGITMPTLVVTGANDVITPPVNSRRIAAAIPNAQLVLIPGAGHSFLFQEPVAVAGVVDAFL